MGSPHEQSDSDGRREHLEGIGVQLIEETTEQDLSEAEEEIASALSLPELPTVKQQIRSIEERQADVHVGKGCTIGTTMTVKDKAVPNLVGVDIGCGMYTVNLGNQEIDLEKFDEVCHYIPSGKKAWDGRKERFDLTELRSLRFLKRSKWIEKSLGTLGGGNHFIETGS